MIWYDMIWYDMIWYDMIWYMIWYDIWYDIWYLILCMIWYMIWLSYRYVTTSGYIISYIISSYRYHIDRYDMIYCNWVVQYTFTNKQCWEQHNRQKQYIEQHISLIRKECGPCPVFASYTLAFALQVRKKYGKTSVRVKKLWKSLKIISLRKKRILYWDLRNRSPS